MIITTEFKLLCCETHLQVDPCQAGTLKHIYMVDLVEEETSTSLLR